MFHPNMVFFRKANITTPTSENIATDFVMPYLELLKDIAETDTNRVVRIYCLGAIKAATL